MQEEMSSEHLILKTLSFFEPMNYAQIIFELDDEELKKMPDFTDEDLKGALAILVKKKQVILIVKDGESFWLKKMPRRNRNLFNQISTFISDLFRKKS